MTTTTETVAVQTTDAPMPERRPSIRVRFAVAFLAGLLAVLAVGAGALYAYDRQYEGRILPGVHAGRVDLSGLTPAAAREQLAAAYGDLSRGEIVFSAPAGSKTVSSAGLGRHVDANAPVAAAAAIGHAGGPLDRVIGNAR